MTSFVIYYNDSYITYDLIVSKYQDFSITNLTSCDYASLLLLGSFTSLLVLSLCSLNSKKERHYVPIDVEIKDSKDNNVKNIV